MQMSEPYAATVAAVAPVIWLVGAVEFHQIVKQMEQVHADREAHLADGLKAIEAEPDDAVAERLLGEFDGPSPRMVGTERVLVYCIWALITLALVVAIVVALLWLGEDGGPGRESGASSGTAVALLYVLVLGFATIILLPVILTSRRLDRRLEHRKALRRAMRRNIDARIARRTTGETGPRDGSSHGAGNRGD